MNQPKKSNLLAEINPEVVLNHNFLPSFLKENIERFSATHDYLKIDFFKDGESFKEMNHSLLKTYSNLETLPCSFRLTNIQILHPEIFKMCEKLRSKLERSFTCNLYYTPGAERNCFDFHADNQITYIYQVQGQKNWLFPLKDNELITHTEPDKLFPKESVERIHCIEVLLSEGNELYVPRGVVHKVEIASSTPSIHLTFGSYEHQFRDFIDNFIALNLEKAGISKNHSLSSADNNGELEKIIEAIKTKILESSTEDFVKQYKKKMFMDELKISKSGRSYKLPSSSNQD